MRKVPGSAASSGRPGQEAERFPAGRRTSAPCRLTARRSASIQHLDTTPRARQGRKLPVVLSPEEVRRLLEATDADHRLVVELIYGCGLRLQELCRLRVKDVDFDLMTGAVFPARSRSGRCAGSLRGASLPVCRGSAGASVFRDRVADDARNRISGSSHGPVFAFAKPAAPGITAEAPPSPRPLVVRLPHSQSLPPSQSLRRDETARQVGGQAAGSRHRGGGLPNAGFGLCSCAVVSGVHPTGIGGRLARPPLNLGAGRPW
jgi:hypothetical protein